MARPADKLRGVVEMIRGRIVQGDDALRGIPGERQLAAELGVSRQTVRTAVGLLEAEGWLSRLPNGRLAVVREGKASQADGTAGAGPRGPVIGFAWGGGLSRECEMWQNGIVRALAGRGTLREIAFGHFGDPALATALHGLDGLFLLPGRGEVPAWLAERIRVSPCRVAVLDFDFSARGLPSISVFPARAERKLVDHLRKLGHRRIDCLNAQILDPVIDARIAAWRRGLEEFGLEGELHAVARYPSIEAAYRLVARKLKTAGGVGTALLCVTGPAAVGAMRACAEAGVAVGRDLSIVAVNDEGFGPYLVPSLTCLQSPPRDRVLRPAVEWMLGAPWRGPLFREPRDIPMFVGESSGPATAPAPRPIRLAKKY